MDTTNIFTVTPMSFNVSLDSGEIYEDKLIIANPANATENFNYKVEISPYAVVGEEYTANFSDDSSRSQIAEWIVVENPTGVLKPNETAEIKFKIKVPEYAPSGGQYAALLISSNNENGTNSGVAVNNVFEMASIIYANIGGETVRSGEVKENNIPGFVTSAPITVSAMLTNEGNVHEVARIGLEVKNFFSSQLIYPQPGDSGIINEVIMPESTRFVTRDITGISSLGVYEVTQTINYLGQNHQITQTVVSCPIWFMALSIITIIAIILAIVTRVKKHHLKRKVF